MALKKIFVSRHTVESNHQNTTTDPVFTIREPDGTEHRSSSIIILGASEVRYDPDGPEGSRIWIETHARIMMKDGESVGNDMMDMVFI